MNCKDIVDSKLAQDNETYIFYCSIKNAMVNYRDCQNCKYNRYSRG